ncbi:MAG: DUF4389 domain-containing protein [Paracoccaceae bacterium]
MAADKNEFDEILDPVEMQEPGYGGGGEGFDAPDNIWMHGLMMVVIAVLSKLVMTIIGVLALVQFLWMLFAKERNPLLMDFGKDLGDWLSDATRFLAGATDDKPFPWAKWG